jgi:hypothetical protein
VDIAETERRIGIFSNKPFARIDVATRGETPLCFSHTTHIFHCISPFQEKDDFAIDEVHRNFLSALIAFNVVVGNLCVGLSQLGIGILCPRCTDVWIQMDDRNAKLGEKGYALRQKIDCIRAINSVHLYIIKLLKALIQIFHYFHKTASAILIATI